MKVHYNR